MLSFSPHGPFLWRIAADTVRSFRGRSYPQRRPHYEPELTFSCDVNLLPSRQQQNRPVHATNKRPEQALLSPTSANKSTTRRVAALSNEGDELTKLAPIHTYS
jgi:hypothetical protein